jgi:hypothetical protein
MKLDYGLTVSCPQDPFLVIIHWDDSGRRNPPDVVGEVPVVVATDLTDNGWKDHLPHDQQPHIVVNPAQKDFDHVMRCLGLNLKQVQHRLHDASVKNDAGYQAITERINVLAPGLNNIVEKFLPEETGIRPTVVAGGWSGDPVIQLHVTGDLERSEKYFLKLAFFRSEAKIKETVERALQAQAWLGDRTVKLHPPVGGFDGFGLAPADTLLEVFSGLVDQRNHPYLPICWQSGAGVVKRRAFRELYREWPVEKLQMAMKAALEILARNQMERWAELEPSQDPGRGEFYRGDFARRDFSRYEVAELQRYGRSCPLWPRRAFDDFDVCLKALSWSTWPAWMTETKAVRRGHVHGDPSGGNILVSVNAPTDIIFIDCGAYLPDGFLATDLARIEAEIKLLLMDSEEKDYAQGPRNSTYWIPADIDPHRLAEWIPAEQSSLRQGLALTETYVETHFAHMTESIQKAYQLIAQVRDAARKVSLPHDETGRHYFAALAATTLRWLSSPHLTHPKKLFAIASAAELLRLKL